jgi:hypothetical protein
MVTVKGMKMGEWISHATKLAAVGSVLFFALELHQNSLQLEAQSRYAQFEIQSYDTNRVVYAGEDLATILLKARNDEPLSEFESFVLQRYNGQLLRNWEFEFMEHERGLLDSNLSVDRWAENLSRNPHLLRVWNSRAAVWQPPFKRALDDAIARVSQ